MVGGHDTWAKTKKDHTFEFQSLDLAEKFFLFTHGFGRPERIRKSFVSVKKECVIPL